MTVDLNKGLSTPITYNYLNLPEVVTKSVNNIRYIYDAAGRKLSQVVRTGLAVSQTDYSGEFIYENDFLRFVNHGEGRIAVSSEKLLYKHDGDVIDGLTALNTTLTPMTINGEKYISASSSGSGSGIFPIGNAISVVPGEKYLIRVKGYRSDYNVAIMVRRNNSTITYGSYLPALVANESWIEQIYVVPANTTTMEVGIGWNSPTGTAHLFLNAFELIKLESSTPEYQYNLKDHLGNVRLTFTTKQDIDSSTATLEDENAQEEQGKFLRYDNTRIVNHFLFDHTKGSKPTQVEGGAQRLSGQGNEIYALAKSLSVMPGDVINMEVYAKYIDPNESNRTAALNTLIMQIAAGTAPGGTVIDGGSYAASTSSFPFPADATQNTSSSSEASPKAFLSWLVYDRNYTLIASKSGFRQMSSVAKEDGSDVAHELLSGTVTITEPGYIYVFLSNEQGTNPYEVYFDDFNVEQVKSPVTQTQDYYSFGLEFNSSQRENSLSQDYKYNGKEDQTALGLGWLDYNARKYMPEIGRWNAIDYMSEKYNSHSPYAYVLNNPIALVDPDGNDVYLIVYYTKSGEIGHASIAFDNYKTEEVKDKNGETVYKDGKAQTRQVKDGTVTVYSFTGSGSPQNPDRDVEGTLRKFENVKIKDLKRFSHEGNAPDALIQVHTTPYITQSIEQENARLYEQYEQGSGMTYNAEKFNCSDFAKASLNRIPGFMYLNGTEKVNAPPNPFRAVRYDANVTTPNFLFSNLKKVVQAGTPRGAVLKENHMPSKDYVNAYSNNAVKDESPNE